MAGGDHGGVVGEGLAALEIEPSDAFVDEFGQVGSAVLEGGRDLAAEVIDVGQVGDEVAAEAAAAHGLAQLLELGLRGGLLLRQFGGRSRVLLRRLRRGFRLIGVELEEEGAGVEGEVEGTEVVVEVVEAEAEGVDGGGEGAQLGHRSHHRRILSVQHYMGIQFPSGCN